MRRLLTFLVLTLLAPVVRADCLSSSPTRQCSECACNIGREKDARPRVYVNEEGRILFGDAPARITALNTSFVVQRATPPGGNACAPASTLYTGQIYLQAPGLSDGNCWKAAASPSWVALGPCAVCY